MKQHKREDQVEGEAFRVGQTSDALVSTLPVINEKYVYNGREMDNKEFILKLSKGEKVLLSQTLQVDNEEEVIVESHDYKITRAEVTRFGLDAGKAYEEDEEKWLNDETQLTCSLL